LREDVIVGRTVIVTVPVFVGSLKEVAVRLTRWLAASDAGGVYVVTAPLAVDVGETVPQDAAEQDTLQLTPLFTGSFSTVAVNCSVVPVITVAVV
jgi:hypothetical protein